MSFVSVEQILYEDLSTPEARESGRLHLTHPKKLRHSLRPMLRGRYSTYLDSGLDQSLAASTTSLGEACNEVKSSGVLVAK